MGVNINVYTVYGVKTAWDDNFFEAHETIEETLVDEFGYGKPIPADRQIETIIDGMGGDYFVFGKILYDSGDFRYCDDMNDFKEIDCSLTALNSIKTEYMEKFNRLYPEHIHLLEGKDWKMFNIIHYS